MTAFRYEAVGADGRKRRGTVEAETARRARQDLIKAGLTLTALNEASSGGKTLLSGSRKKEAKPKDVIMATRQLATLIDAAMPIEEALAAVATQEDGRPIARTLTAVRTRVIEGWKLSDALAEHPKAFSRLYIGIVAAGESSGTLGPVLGRLADMLERNRAILGKAITALIYPAVIAVVAVVVVWAMMRFIVPKMAEQFADMGAELPWITRIVVGISDFVGDYGLLVFTGIVAAIAGFVVARRTPAPRRAIDKFVLRLPLVGPLARDLDAARFARTLSTLFASGTPLLDALKGAQRTVTNDHTRAELDGMMTNVREGASLSASVRKAAVFPPMMASMIAAGERAGKLPDMLEKTADQMEAGFERATTLALRLLEPTVIVSLAVVVLVIMLAIMMPILQLNTFALGGV